MSARDDVRRWRDPAAWRGWNGLTVSEAPTVRAVRVAEAIPQQVHADLKTEGWFQVHNPYQDDIIARLREGVWALRKRKLPPIFLWVFDETWEVFARMDPVWRIAMGPTYKVLPCFWAWYVPRGVSRSGWPVHRDRTRGALNVHKDGRPKTLSVWIALSRATPHNGCMYVVPAPHAPDHSSGIKLQDVRALPAEPGDVLGWRQDLFHWGGRSSARAEEPRLSLGLELQGWTEHTFDRPLLEPGEIPPLDVRLALIGGNLWRYRGRLSNKRLIPLAKALMAIRPDLDQSATDPPLPRPERFRAAPKKPPAR